MACLAHWTATTIVQNIPRSWRRGAAVVTTTSYFKRFCMEVRLDGIPPLELPTGMQWIGWHPTLIDVHARVLYDSFHREIDAIVFPSLSDLHGCQVLMQEIARKRYFLPGSTWLLADAGGQPCGSIQGIQDRGRGAIQNVGVLPEYRGRGVGRALILRALHGFQQLGLGLGMLEATAENERAVRLYRRLGFRKARVIYKPVPVPGGLESLTEQPHDWLGFDV